ncbi:MAG: InlB B-repeat-containing protein, partial [Firmicutes bacterium]|nr:InlB B-repeat-containing protein [Bacillota bacterium]
MEKATKKLLFTLLAFFVAFSIVGASVLTYVYAAEKITLSTTGGSVLVGGKQLAAATVKADGVVLEGDELAKVEWTSSDTEIATVDSTGVITSGSNTGKVTITAKYEGLTATRTVTVKNPEATIDGEGYLTFSAAINAVKGTTGKIVVLGEDLSLAGVFNRFTVESGTEYTIDLNGKALSMNGAYFTLNGGELTVTNGTISVKGNMSQEFTVNSGTLNITESANINCTGSVSPIAVFGSAMVNTAGNLSSESSFAIAGNGSSGKGGYTINITGGELKSNSAPAIYHPNDGTVNISGGTIIGATAVYQKSGELNITGGTFNANGAKADYIYNGNGANSTGDAIVIDNCGYPGGAPVANISGGTFTSENANAVASYGYGGNEPIEKFISGGKYSNDVEQEYLVDDVDSYPLPDGTYVVGESATLTMAATKKGVAGNSGDTIGSIKIDAATATAEQKAEIVWSSDDDGVVEVASNGVLTYVSEGSTTVTGTYRGSSASCVITVDPAVVEYTAASGKVTYQSSIPSAFSSGTYKLLADVTRSARMTPGTFGNDVVLDLNGKTLTSTASDYAILLGRNGTEASPYKFAIIDSSDEKGGKLVVNSGAQAAIQAQGKYNEITIGEGVTIDGGCVAVLSENQTVSINGTVNGGGDFALATNGISTKNASITIGSTAVLTSNIPAVYLPGNEGLNAVVEDGAEITGSTGIEIRGGNLEIKGGKITATGEFSEAANGNGSTISGAAVAISQHTTDLPISVTISGGEFTGAKALYEKDLQNNVTEDVEINIQDGKFTGAVESENATEFIHGGAYKPTTVDEAVEEGKVLVLDTDGYYRLTDLYIVSFDSDGGSDVEEQKVAKDAKVEKPEDPTKEGYEFAGWQLNGEDYDFENTKVTADIELKATWKYVPDWGEATYTWSDDNSQVTASREDRNVEHKSETETVDATAKVTKEATHAAKGETTYTSEAFTNAAFKVQTKTVEDIPALGHDWGEATYTWSDDNSQVTATRVCKLDGTHVETETVDATAKVTKEATHAAKGETTYTSEAFTNAAFKVQT